jgi:hypothetical protein
MYEVVKARTTAEALGASACDGFERTDRMYVLNETGNASLKLVLFRVTCRYDLPEPYIKDTGVFVGGVDLPVGANADADPCDAGGVHRPIAATAGQCSVLVRLPNGSEQQMNLTSYPECEEGNYYPEMGWRIFYGSSLTDTGEKVKVLASSPLGRLAKI